MTDRFSNHLFIGLGGQGGKSLAALRRVFAQREDDAKRLEDLGVVCDYLYIDSSSDVRKERKIWRHFGQNLELSPDSIMSIQGDGSSLDVESLALKPDIASWLGDRKKVAEFLGGEGKNIQGANQRRRFGRILFAENADSIRNALEEKVGRLAERANQCAFHIYATLGGGTGSGSVVDLVAMIRTIYGNGDVDHGFPIFLYLYVTTDDSAKAGYFYENQYAALRDINALICGRFKPTLLGAYAPGKQFAGSKPINGIVLSGNLNEKNQAVPIEKQHGIMAEFGFERIFAYCNGDLSPRVQAGLTNQDTVLNFPGEPLRNSARSFRFAAGGMSRWEIPIEEIRELLANDLFVSVFRQFLYQNWDGSDGFVANKKIGNASGVDQTCRNLLGIIALDLPDREKLPELEKSLAELLQNRHDSAKANGYRGMDLAEYERALRSECDTGLNGVGVRGVFHDLEQRRNAMVDEISQKAHNFLRSAWSSVNNPIGMADIMDVLDAFKIALEKEIAVRAEPKASNESALRNLMNLREGEWRKITVLSSFFKCDDLADAHRRNLHTILLSEIRGKIGRECSKILDDLVVRVSGMINRYGQALDEMEGWLSKTEARRNELYGGLQQLTGSGKANRFELDIDAIRSYLSVHRTMKNELKGIGQQFRKDVVDKAIPNRNLDAIRSVSETRESKEKFWEEAERLVYPEVGRIHRKLVEDVGQKPILTSSILEALQKHYDASPDGFRRDLEMFIKSASTSVMLRHGELQPKVLADNPGMKQMPIRALVIGLPRKGRFAQVLKEMIPSLIPAGESLLRDVYFHDDDTQIRMMVMVYWMAARFTKIAGFLEEEYGKSMVRDREGDKAYFSNLDVPGERGERPQLLLPSPAEIKTLGKAALWLGQRIDVGGQRLLSASGEGVVLVERTEEGVNPVRIGDSFKSIEDHADVVLLTRIYDAVGAAGEELSEDRRNEIRELVKKEDQKKLDEHGIASEAYRSWCGMRDEIYRLLPR